MTHASLKEQLQAVAAQITTAGDKKPAHKKKMVKLDKPHKLKSPWLDYVQYGVELLRAYFPQCFKAGREIRPLKKGIKQDLVKALSELDKIVITDKACMVKSLGYYVNTLAYHKCVQAGCERIDLAGKAAGVVSLEEAHYSQQRHLVREQQKTNKLHPIADAGTTATTV
jgi:ProP effector